MHHKFFIALERIVKFVSVETAAFYDKFHKIMHDKFQRIKVINNLWMTSIEWKQKVARVPCIHLAMASFSMVNLTALI